MENFFLIILLVTISTKWIRNAVLTSIADKKEFNENGT